MIEHRADEGIGVMTDTTILIGQVMAGRLANCKHVVMAGAAVIDNACMVKICRQEARGDMALVAVIVGRHMVRRRCLATRGRTIVA